MKYNFIALILFLLPVVVVAQSKEEAEVTKAVETLHKAMIDANKEALDKATAAGLSYGHSNGRVENKKEFIESLTSGKSDFVTIDITEQTISIQNNVAIVRHILSGTTNDSGKPGTVKLKVLLVFTKQHGTWQLLARQAVKFN